MDEIEVPQYFICPISLQIMKDPVTAITGITYDRDSIEHWLFRNKNITCPVTKQPLPLDSDLTPNHTLRRLIQSWCTQNASLGIDRIPTPKPPLTKTHVQKLVKDMKDSKFQLKSLMQLELLAAENERNRKCLLENGVPKSMIMFLVDCYKKGEILEGIEEALSFLQFVKVPTEEVKNLLSENDQILDSLTWILSSEMKNSVAVKSHAVMVLKKFINKCDSIHLERLKPEFFDKIVKILKYGVITQQGLCSCLHVLLCCCPLGRNRLMMVEAGVVRELIEIELTAVHEKRITELTFGILFHLCSCANGRFQFLSHEGSIAVLTERILKVSMTVDDRAVFILSLISKFSATKNVLDEMLKVGTVSKLFVLLQADHAKYLKDKVMQIFKAHSEVWKNSPCFPQTSFYAS
ncbi:E3 ubiquitin-protein ligase PUB23 [Trifolium repens]|nr:E3 ubiquitin-protein ligase PUB23 [Trifolium repens]